MLWSPHFTDEDAETWNAGVTSPRTHVSAAAPLISNRNGSTYSTGQARFLPHRGECGEASSRRDFSANPDVIQTPQSSQGKESVRPRTPVSGARSCRFSDQRHRRGRRRCSRICSPAVQEFFRAWLTQRRKRFHHPACVSSWPGTRVAMAQPS